MLDTGTLVGAHRGTLNLRQHLTDSDVAVSAVTVAEWLEGVDRADGETRAKKRRDFLTGLLQTVSVEDYTHRVAEQHALLLSHTRREGSPRGAHDLIIAATAAATRRVLLTTDKKARFGELPGVDAHELSGNS